MTNISQKTVKVQRLQGEVEAFFAAGAVSSESGQKLSVREVDVDEGGEKLVKGHRSFRCNRFQTLSMG